MTLPALALRRLWPSQLSRQVFVMTSVTILTCGIIYSLIAERRLASLAHDSLKTQAAALAHSVASGGALHMVTKDATALESLLLQSAAHPGIRSVVVSDNSGQVSAAVRTAVPGEPKPDFDKQRVIPPYTDPSATSRIFYTIAQETISAFAPIHNGERIGWVRVELGRDSEWAIRQDARHDALISATVISLLTLVALYIFLGRALGPLTQCARFATGLSTRLGSELRIASSSVEIEGLVRALNYASHEIKDKLAQVAKSEALTQSVLDTAADAIIGFTVDGVITFINPAGRHIFGIDAAGPVDQKVEQLLPEVTAQRIAAFMKNGVHMSDASALTERFETHGLRNGGIRFPAEVALGLLDTAEGRRLTCIARDQTEKQMADDHLRLFNRALEHSSNGVVIADTAYPGLPIIFANPAFERITGFAVDEVLGQNCRLLQGNDGEQAEIDVLRTAIREGSEAKVTLRNYRKDGSMFWNELSIAPVRAPDGAITHFVGIQSDVTEARRAAQELAEHSARLDTVFSMSPDGFVMFEKPGRLTATNPAFLAMTGLSHGDLAGITLEAFDQLMVARCDAQSGYSPIESMFEPADAANDRPQLVTLMQPERRILHRLVRLTEGGHELILYFRDVTRETEVDRMKSEFLSTAAHELRTPMVSIYGFSELLLKRKYPEDRQRQFIDTIYRQTGRLVKMVNELLDLARIEARAGKDFKVGILPIAPIVREAVNALCAPDDRHTLHIDLPDDLPHVAVDPEKFTQALTNVLGNAYKYSREGEIRVRTRSRILANRRQIGIVIEDEGIGMTPEQTARAFERFFRADASGNIPGTGLGLCLVKEIVELLGGNVELASELGKGTSVTLWLPVAEAALALAA